MDGHLAWHQWYNLLIDTWEDPYDRCMIVYDTAHADTPSYAYHANVRDTIRGTLFTVPLYTVML